MVYILNFIHTITHLGNVWERGCGCVPKKFEFFCFTKIKYGLYVLDRFDVLMSKIIFKK
jgi:hypothetical protein